MHDSVADQEAGPARPELASPTRNQRSRPEPTARTRAGRQVPQAEDARSSSMIRAFAGSIGTPGPMVEQSVTDLM